MTNHEKVREFMLLFQSHMVDQPMTGNHLHFRRTLSAEESKEVDEAAANCQMKADLGHDIPPDMRAALVKELCDVLYVTYGFGATFGIDLDKAFALVHASNMSKVGEDGIPIRREDGKILKGPNYWEPDLSGF